MKLNNILISGYRSYELNIFNHTDPKYIYLKKFIKNRLIRYIEEGVEWFVITGQLGIELWAGEVVIELKEESPDINLAVLLPYTSFGEKWNEMNKTLFEEVVRQADYVNYTSNSSIPDAKCGLKPVARRILWGAYDGGYTSSKEHAKCARIVGDVMGRWHPHGRG